MNDDKLRVAINKGDQVISIRSLSRLVLESKMQKTALKCSNFSRYWTIFESGLKWKVLSDESGRSIQTWSWPRSFDQKWLFLEGPFTFIEKDMWLLQTVYFKPLFWPLFSTQMAF